MVCVWESIFPFRKLDKNYLYSISWAMHHSPRLKIFFWLSWLVAFVFLPIPSLFSAGQEQAFLTGTTKGLYLVRIVGASTEIQPLWEGGSVRSIIPAREGWYFLGSTGVLFSPDLGKFENRASGLPTKTLTVFENGTFKQISGAEEIKSLAVDPAQKDRIAVCTNTEVWYSESGGKTWKSLGAPSTIPGTKALSFGPWQNSGSPHALWISHSIKGVFVRDPSNGPGWISAGTGLPKAAGANGEEVSSFALLQNSSNPLVSRLQTTPMGSNGSWTLYAGLSFLGRLYEWNPQAKSFVERWNDRQDFGSLESLTPLGSEGLAGIAGSKPVRFSLQNGKDSTAFKNPEIQTGLLESILELAQRMEILIGEKPSCVTVLPQADLAIQNPSSLTMSLGELWMLYKGNGLVTQDAAEARRRMADGKIGLYLQTGFVTTAASREKYFSLIKDKGLNSLVVDMKDDYGRLRFAPLSPLLKELGVQGDKLDIESFSAQAKGQGLYLIARIVVFKDESLYKTRNGSFAVRDSSSGVPWRGIKTDGQPIGEFWVDPYSTEVWNYNVEIAKEVLSRGFDEVQFDYIRFPTDGENLLLARYPQQKPGMNPDSALESFLRFARQSIDAPISIDIYGANGWYRSGTRTGQDVEMLAHYADVVCPMLYPSHFEQSFMAQAPAELRPYRIYRLGTLRNQAIARGHMLVRPYVQAFYLDVSYDRLYYSPRYVELEIQGVREGANQGMTFWNNSGRYTDLPELPKP